MTSVKYPALFLKDFPPTALFPAQTNPQVKPLNLQFVTGDFTVVTGANGSGKTTLLRYLSGQILPDVGQVFWAKTNLRELSKRQLAKLQRQRAVYLPQLPEINKNLLVKRLLSPYLSSQQLHHQANQQLFQDLALADVWELHLNDISVGQQQLVMIAQGLMQNPALLFLDEPTALLDDELAEVVLATLKNHAHQRKQTIVATTYDAYVASFADRVLFLDQGSIQAEIQQPDYNAVIEGWAELPKFLSSLADIDKEQTQAPRGFLSVAERGSWPSPVQMQQRLQQLQRERGALETSPASIAETPATSARAQGDTASSSVRAANKAARGSSAGAGQNVLTALSAISASGPEANGIDKSSIDSNELAASPDKLSRYAGSQAYAADSKPGVSETWSASESNLNAGSAFEDTAGGITVAGRVVFNGSTGEGAESEPNNTTASRSVQGTEYLRRRFPTPPLPGRGDQWPASAASPNSSSFPALNRSEGEQLPVRTTAANPVAPAAKAGSKRPDGQEFPAWKKFAGLVPAEGYSAQTSSADKRGALTAADSAVGSEAIGVPKAETFADSSGQQVQMLDPVALQALLSPARSVVPESLRTLQGAKAALAQQRSQPDSTEPAAQAAAETRNQQKPVAEATEVATEVEAVGVAETNQTGQKPKVASGSSRGKTRVLAGQPGDKLAEQLERWEKLYSVFADGPETDIPEVAADDSGSIPGAKALPEAEAETTLSAASNAAYDLDAQLENALGSGDGEVLDASGQRVNAAAKLSDRGEGAAAWEKPTQTGRPSGEREAPQVSGSLLQRNNLPNQQIEQMIRRAERLLAESKTAIEQALGSQSDQDE